MTAIAIPASVRYIDMAFFQLLPNAAEITVADENPTYTSYNGMLFGANDAGEPTNLLLVPEGMEGDAVLPAYMASVPACVFSRCIKLSAISVDTFAGSAATSAFTSQDGILYTNDMSALVAAPAGLGVSAVIAPGCADIQSGAFAGNADLVTIVAPAGIATIAEDAFEDAAIQQATIVLPADADQTVWEAAGFTSFAQTPVSGAIATPAAGTGLCYTLQDDYTLAASWQGADAPETIEIPAFATLGGASYPVASIAAEGFAGQHAITAVTMPDTLITIGASAFADCASLSDVGLARVRSIEARAFANTALTSIMLPSSTAFVGEGAFDGLSNATVVAASAATDVHPNALGSSTGMDVYVPYVPDEAYAWAAGLPTSGNHIYPYGVQLNPDALNLEVGETANLFAEPGYLYAPGDITLNYSYSAKTVSVNVSTGEITAKRSGPVNVDVTLDLPLREG